jgi:hypothetical protein
VRNVDDSLIIGEGVISQSREQLFGPTVKYVVNDTLPEVDIQTTPGNAMSTLQNDDLLGLHIEIMINGALMILM